jgi:hypothetical protein
MRILEERGAFLDTVVHGEAYKQGAGDLNHLSFAHIVEGLVKNLRSVA